MVDQLRGDAWRFVCAIFPERQIYIRSDGRVQFFTFGPMMQVILAGIALIFLGWVAFTSVNTIFKDRIIASKERNFRQMQTSYEKRVTDLQISYDLLNTALVTAEDRFHSIADDLAIKHQTLATILHRTDILQASLGLGMAEPAPAVTGAGAAPSAVGGAFEQDQGAIVEGRADFLVPGSGFAPVSADVRPLNPVPQSPVPQSDVPEINFSKPPSVLRSGQQTFLRGAVQRLGALFQVRSNQIAVDHPILRRIAAEEARLRRLLPAQHVLAVETENVIADATEHLESTLRIAGMDPDVLVDRVIEARGGTGGPLVPLVGFGLTDEFGQEALEALEQFADVVAAVRAVPLAVPLASNEYWLSSGFGRRRDPFTKNLAFHAGVDFSGVWGTAVLATAPGEVVYAGSRGAYGNTVEIDHGYGIRTRYGHLSRIQVTVGTRLEKGDSVGKLGSTGRSTGPHVHYEVWYDDRARNPSNFLRAGQYVLEK